MRCCSTPITGCCSTGGTVALAGLAGGGLPAAGGWRRPAWSGPGRPPDPASGRRRRRWPPVSPSGSPPALELRDVSFPLSSGRSAGRGRQPQPEARRRPGPGRPQPVRRSRRDRGRHRAERRRKVHAAAAPQRPAPAHGRQRAGQRAEHRRAPGGAASPATSGCSSSIPVTSCLSGPWNGKSASAWTGSACAGSRRTPPRHAQAPGRQRTSVRQALAAVGLEHSPAGTRRNSRRRSSGCWRWPPSWPGRPASWPWTSPPSPWTGMDWPVLDPVVRHAAAEGTAVVLVTHDLDYARSIAHRIGSGVRPPASAG